MRDFPPRVGIVIVTIVLAESFCDLYRNEIGGKYMRFMMANSDRQMQVS